MGEPTLVVSGVLFLAVRLAYVTSSRHYHRTLSNVAEITNLNESKVFRYYERLWPHRENLCPPRFKRQMKELKACKAPVRHRSHQTERPHMPERQTNRSRPRSRDGIVEPK